MSNFTVCFTVSNLITAIEGQSFPSPIGVPEDFFTISHENARAVLPRLKELNDLQQKYNLLINIMYRTNRTLLGELQKSGAI